MKIIVFEKSAFAEQIEQVNLAEETIESSVPESDSMEDFVEA